MICKTYHAIESSTPNSTILIHMKKLLFPIGLIAVLLGLYHFDIITINAAQIYLKDIDVKVIYHYEDDYEFVGYHERSMVHLEEGNLGLNIDYTPYYQDIADEDKGNFYQINFQDSTIKSNPKRINFLDICLDEKKFEIQRENISFRKDKIIFSFDSALDVYTHLWNPHTRKWNERTQFTNHERDFRVKGEFEISGIYNEKFIRFQIERLILYKLKYTTTDYFNDYHGINGIANFYFKFSRFFDGLFRVGIGLPHMAYDLSKKEEEEDQEQG